MLCLNICPKCLDNCSPLSNVVADDHSSFVCVGLHKDIKEKYSQDRFRHCFKSESTDSVFDYDEYDIKSVISVMAEALLIDELKNS